MISLPVPPPDPLAELIGRPLVGPPPGTPTILVVDDEDGVRELIRDILSQEGCYVLVARDGDEALVVAEWHAGPIHVLITDVRMAHVGGGELVARLRALRGETRLVCISGYPDDPVVQREIVERGIPFLPKPFTPDALVAKVREALEGGSRG
jgi:DNA-binding NtrC family response regulator